MATIWSTFRRLFNKEGVSNPDTGYQLPSLERTSTSSGMSVTDEQSLKLSAVWASVQLISNSVAGLPLEVYRDKESGREPLKSRHFLTDIFHYKPNAHMKPRDFRAAMTVQMAIWNNAYAEIQHSGDRVVGLMPLRPGRMTPFITDDGDLTYHYQVDSGVKVYAARSIFHLKGMGTDGVVALERNNFARETYGLAASAEQYAAQQFAKGRPGGVIEFDEFLTPKQREQIRGVYEALTEGAVNANSLYVLEGGMKYHALDFTADQLQMIATRAHQLSDVARFFGVPGVLIGAGDNNNSAWPASFEQQMLMFLTHTVQPYLDEWESAIRHSFLDRNNDIDVDHDVTPLVQMDSNAKANYLGRLVQNGLMTRNEGREKLHLPRVEGGDELTVQTNLLPIDELEGATNDQQNQQPARPMPAEVQQ